MHDSVLSLDDVDVENTCRACPSHSGILHPLKGGFTWIKKVRYFFHALYYYIIVLYVGCLMVLSCSRAGPSKQDSGATHQQETWMEMSPCLAYLLPTCKVTWTRDDALDSSLVSCFISWNYY
jgi:hypothetical protein